MTRSLVPFVSIVPVVLLACATGTASAAERTPTGPEEYRREPFAGDVVNNSPHSVLVWGRNVGGSGEDFACLLAYHSTHDWRGAVDVEFAYSAKRRKWCNIGIGEARIDADANWTCPGGWETPSYLPYDKGC